MLSPSQQIKARLIAAAGSPFIRGIGRTLTWRVHNIDYLDATLRSGRRPILAFWHGRIFAGLNFFRDRGIVVITSRNFDGEWIARILPRFGYGTARGSTSAGAVRALVQLRRDLAAGRPVAFPLDGPRGPARVAQPGAVWLAGATGHPIIPFHLESNRHWTLSSWDRAQIPKPFSTVALAIGEPIQVPDTSESTIEAHRVELQTSLGCLEAEALQMLRTDR